METMKFGKKRWGSIFKAEDSRKQPSLGCNVFEVSKCIGTKGTSTGNAAERLSNPSQDALATVAQREQTAKLDGVICVVLVL